MARLINSDYDGSNTGGISPWIGWGISTLLLLFLRRNRDRSSNTDSQQPSKFTDSTVNSVGSAVPVVLGRGLIKDPIVSYYGSFRADIYTEEYGLHTALDVWSFLFPLILNLIMALSTPDKIVIKEGEAEEDTSSGQAALDKGGDFVKSPVTTSGGASGGTPGGGSGSTPGTGGSTPGTGGSTPGTGDTEIGIGKNDKRPKAQKTKLEVLEGIKVEGSVEAGPYAGEITEAQTTERGKVEGEIIQTNIGAKTTAVTNAIVQLIIWLIFSLFTQHLGRVTIQKGFLYYLGWQHIICWTGKNTGLKRIWMNVYDGELETSINKGVWDNSGKVAWERDNSNGISAFIDDPLMFGGWDEGGGFKGEIRFYFGNRQQPKDSWMIHEMQASTIPADLRGLTPQYPMYLTCVVSNKDKKTGAYIGKQSQVPEMWFEVVNYPDRLATDAHTMIKQKFNLSLQHYLDEILSFMQAQAQTVQQYMQQYIQQLETDITDYIAFGAPSLIQIEQDVDDVINNFPPTNRDVLLKSASPLKELASHGVWQIQRIGDDLNPAVAIYEILRNKYWGCGYDKDRINIESLVDMGIICESEELGISCVINRVARANDYIVKILEHINGVKYDSPVTGQISFKLIRNDFDINEIKTFDVSNCESCEYSRLDWSEVSTAVSLRFIDAQNKYEEGQYLQTDVANEYITQLYSEKQVDGTYFTTASNAKWMAQNKLLSAGYPLAAVHLVTNRIAYDLTIGDPIKITWQPYGLKQTVFRVTDIDYASLESGKITITAMEDVFSFDKTEYEFSDAPQWTTPDPDPEDITRYLYMEEPYERTLSLDSYLYAYASQPSSTTVVWDVWQYINGNYSITARSTQWSTVGKLVYGYSEGYALDTTGFELSSIGSENRIRIDNKINLINSKPTMYNRTSALNLLVIDDEIMSYDTIVPLPNGNYQVKGVVRGVYDTIPATHTSESVVFFMEERLNVNSPNPVATQGNVKAVSMELRTETANKSQGFDLTKIESFVTTRRSEQPSIMANLRFGADKGTETTYYYNIPTTQKISHDILFTSITRNKFNSYGIIEQTDNTQAIFASPTTKNVVHVSCHGEEFDIMSDAYDSTLGQNIPDFTLSWADFCKNMNSKISDANAVTLSIGTYDDNTKLYSYASYKKSINYVCPKLAGIVTSATQVQALADTFVQPALNSILLPATTVSPQQTLTFEDCALIFVANPYTATSQSVPVLGQDGQQYELTTEAYRIDGYDVNGQAIVHKITIADEYIFRSNYTTLLNNTTDFFRFRNNGNVYAYVPY